MTVPKAPAVGIKEVHVSVKRSRDYQAVEVSAVATLEAGADEGAALAKVDELYALLAEDAESRIGQLTASPAKPAASQDQAIAMLQQMTQDVPPPSDDDAPPFYDNEAWEAKKQPETVVGQQFLMAKKPDKAKGPKQFRYLSADDMSKRELEDASKALAAAQGFAADQLIAFDNRDRLDKPGWGACVVKARRGSDLAEKLGDRDTVGYTAWNADGKLVLDVWAKL
jgi:hypothetical protein